MNQQSEDPAPRDVRRIFVLSCPKCAAQIEAKPDSFGHAATCECGQQYRVTLAIQRIPVDTDGVWLRGQRVCVACWTWCTVTWRKSIWPCALAVSRCVRDKWFPAAVNTIVVACRNIATGINSIFASPNLAAPTRATSTAEQPVYWSDGTQSLGMLEILKNGRGTDGFWSE
jgi:hypothetical protein